MKINRRSLLHLVFALTALTGLSFSAVAKPPAVGVGFGQPLPAAKNDTVLNSLYIAMPDGTRLAADIYRPAKNGVALEGRFPVVLHHTAARTRLGDNADRSGTGKFSLQMINLASHGYVYVQVERRGISASFGVRRGYHDRTEAQDAFDLAAWIVQQPWSDGKIGAYGCSNTGDAAMHMLTKPSPNLKAVFAGCFAWDKYSGGYRGGILANWGTGPQGSIELDMKSTPVDGDENKVLLRQAAEQHVANTFLLDLWSGMPYRDNVSPLTKSAFWDEGSIGTYVDQVQASKIPVYIQGGWNDDFRTQGLLALANMKQPAKLIIGPWDHCESANFSMTAEVLRFFDYWLKGIKNGIMDEPAIHYTTANAPVGNEWRSADRWPLVAAKPTPHYFSAPSGLAANDHKFSTKAAKSGAASTSFKVDYQPVPCAKGGLVLGPTCPQDVKGLTFTSPVLDADLEVTGFPIVDMWVSSTATDGPLFAYLEDLAPDNGIAMISEGRLRASLRTLNKAPYALPQGLPWHGFYQADAKMLVPGVPVQLVFDMMPISYIFKAGHRYRLTFTGADPREKLRKIVDPAPSWTIYYDAKHPSHVVLPIVSPSASGPVKKSPAKAVAAS